MFPGHPPEVLPFSGLGLGHGDAYFVTATWCNIAQLCTSIKSARTTVDLMQPMVGGFYGSQYSVEFNKSAVMRFQSFDDASFTLTVAYDADSGVDSLAAGVESVGSGSDAIARKVHGLW